MLFISNYINFIWKLQVDPYYFVGASLLQLDPFLHQYMAKHKGIIMLVYSSNYKIISENPKNQTQK
jgi:hypothetical protein